MPLIEPNYNPPFYFKNGFVSTVYSGLIRKVKLDQERERITLSDGDFLDLDWSYSQTETKKLIILLHGLEGHGQRPYITGPAKLFNENGVDALCVNFRGCSGEKNLKYYSYHSGSTADLDEVIRHAIVVKKYEAIYLKGISLGANVILKYLGEGRELWPQVKAGIAVSVPCSLWGSCQELHKIKNKLFHDRFLKDLLKRLQEKRRQFPQALSLQDMNRIKTLKDFDDVYTARAHGFKDALDYYEKSSCLQYLPYIKIPALIINALNDSFLSPECYPVKEAKNNMHLYLEMTKYGGHSGFIYRKNLYYNEKRALEFIQLKTPF